MKAIVIGAGIGGLCAAISLAARGWAVEVWEAAETPGGKAGTVRIAGIDVDTGPSLLTMPDAFDTVLAPAGVQLTDLVRLVRPAPAFLYHWPDGTKLPIYAQKEETLASVERVLGSKARAELSAFLDHTARTWAIAAPRFLYAPSIDLSELFSPRAIAGLGALDPFRSMETAITRMVREPHLRDVLRRYATYNGSDPNRAPATLNCIAHVELTLGGWGVAGGIGALVTALAGLAASRGVVFRYATRATRVRVVAGRVTGVEAGEVYLAADAVVCNADAAHLLEVLARGVRTGLTPAEAPSLSGWTGIFRASGTIDAGHSVFFPGRYPDEFTDLFDRDMPPADPTVYASAPALAHEAGRWPDAQPLFTMINAPAGWHGGGHEFAAVARARLLAAGLLRSGDPLEWSRTPADLAARFPGSRGAIYGGSSNGMFAAFKRPPNRIPGVKGLYLASGSAHPGGGMPLCALSARAAADACVADGGAS